MIAKLFVNVEYANFILIILFIFCDLVVDEGPYPRSGGFSPVCHRWRSLNRVAGRSG